MLIITVALTGQENAEKKPVKKTIMSSENYNKLSEFDAYVILQKGTERPWTGEFVDHNRRGNKAEDFSVICEAIG